MDTPLLYMHGDNDQIVEYLQGVECYRALRFFGHDLKGEPAPAWLQPGERFGDESRRDPIRTKVGGQAAVNN